MGSLCIITGAVGLSVGRKLRTAWQHSNDKIYTYLAGFRRRAAGVFAFQFVCLVFALMNALQAPLFSSALTADEGKVPCHSQNRTDVSWYECRL